MEEQPFREERVDSILKHVDTLLPHLPDVLENNSLPWIPNNKDITDEDNWLIQGASQHIIKRMISLGYITERELYVELTDKGRAAKNAGGHFAYENKLAAIQASLKQRERLSDEKLKYDVKNSKRIFKTYWFTFSIAILGFIISLVLGILKLMEVLGNP